MEAKEKYNAHKLLNTYKFESLETIDTAISILKELNSSNSLWEEITSLELARKKVVGILNNIKYNVGEYIQFKNDFYFFKNKDVCEIIKISFQLKPKYLLSNESGKLRWVNQDDLLKHSSKYDPFRWHQVKEQE